MSFLGDAFSIPPKGAGAPAATAPPKPAAAAEPAGKTADPAPKAAPSAAPPATASEELQPPKPSGPAIPVAPPLPGMELPVPAPEAAQDATEGGLVVIVTPRAAQEVRRIVEEQKLPATTGLRLGVQGGGCSGFSYKLGFETMKAPLDWEGESSGIPIYIDPKSFLYLSGVELDFQDSLMGRGFVFNNPNAKKTCGCGESFQV
ncbi:MAG TPA: iron-sulfur cluster assembly accessory protein [Planctomycetota bacterium]|nr:iron-sulfur cluster assembly accessory protein [Planctomycetota bacterium]